MNFFQRVAVFLFCAMLFAMALGCSMNWAADAAYRRWGYKASLWAGLGVLFLYVSALCLALFIYGSYQK